MIDIAVGYDDDTDRIVDVVRDVARELMQDPAYAASILEPLEVLGVDAFKATEVTLRFRIKTLPLKQWEVGRELRRRIKKAFDAKASGSRPADELTFNRSDVEAVFRPACLKRTEYCRALTNALRLVLRTSDTPICWRRVEFDANEQRFDGRAKLLRLSGTRNCRTCGWCLAPSQGQRLCQAPTAT